MLTTKLRIAALLVLTIVALAAWGIIVPRGAHGDAAPTPAAPKVPKELLEKRREEAKTVWEQKWHMYERAGRWPLSELFGWSERLLDAELPLLNKQEDRIKSLKAHLDRTRELERVTIVLARMGSARESDAHAATYERINAEIRYFEATGKVPPPPPEAKKENPEKLSPAKENKRNPGKKDNQR